MFEHGTTTPQLVLLRYVDGTPSVLKAGQYLGDLRGEHRNRFAAPRRNAAEDGHLQMRVQRMVLNFLRHGVRQVDLFGNDVRYVANCPLSLQEHHWGTSALSFVSQETGPNTSRHSVSPLAPRAFTRASLATVKDHDSYETACRRCERWITLQSAAQHANVVAHLAWRKQNSRPHG